MLQLCLPSIRVPQMLIAKAHMAILKLWSRNGDDNGYFNEVANLFDESATFLFEAATEKEQNRVTVKRWYRAQREALRWYGDEDDWKAIFEQPGGAINVEKCADEVVDWSGHARD